MILLQILAVQFYVFFILYGSVQLFYFFDRDHSNEGYLYMFSQILAYVNACIILRHKEFLKYLEVHSISIHLVLVSKRAFDVWEMNQIRAYS